MVLRLLFGDASTLDPALVCFSARPRPPGARSCTASGFLARAVCYGSPHPNHELVAAPSHVSLDPFRAHMRVPQGSPYPALRLLRWTSICLLFVCASFATPCPEHHGGICGQPAKPAVGSARPTACRHQPAWGPRQSSTHWLVERGDNPAWADPAFDDSSWPAIDIGTFHPERHDLISGTGSTSCSGPACKTSLSLFVFPLTTSKSSRMGRTLVRAASRVKLMTHTVGVLKCFASTFRRKR